MSEFWQRKMRTYFQRIDFDKDGSITRKDFEGMATRFIESGKLSGPQATELQQNILDVWDKNLGPSSGVDAISQDKFIEVMKSLVGNPALKQALEGPLPLFFKAVDANHDDYIQADEYAQFFQILGLDPAMAPDSFKAIDTDGDGRLSLQEFVTAGSEFFQSEDESKPTKSFWGPLVLQQ
jgi:Ca2+-binding EF-hand superfamily protein